MSRIGLTDVQAQTWLVHNRGVVWETRQVGTAYDALAPDGSQIRLLVQVDRGSLVHCTLPPGEVTQAVRHRTVEEVWYCVAGMGQVWRQQADAEEVVDVAPGVALSIPVGVAFQFRTTGLRPFELVITTLPPWPGADEAQAVDGVWEPSHR
jgi:mannose-6-phosphate isomerase-like protein (cupin superfamily)